MSTPLEIQHSSTLSAMLKTEQGIDLYLSRSKDISGSEDMLIMATSDTGGAHFKLNEDEVGKLRGFLNMQLHEPR